MNKHFIALILTIGFSTAASAEMYKWVDENGDVHFSDRPQHTNAGRIQLAYTVGNQARQPDGEVEPSADESAAETSERERAEAYFCKQATEAYDEYKSAPSLYKTDDDGQREYLSDEEVADLLAETRSKISEWCR